MQATDFQVRPFAKDDGETVIKLMRKLAVFEGYLDQFCVTQDDLAQRILGPQPQANILVADTPEQGVIGMTVYLFIPYTIDLRPDCILKELYVSSNMRGSGVGFALMTALQDEARKAGCGRIKWLVLKGNEKARKFYRSLGGRQDTKWENWTLDMTDATS